MTKPNDAPNRYFLGHSDRELERLSNQARLVEPITRRFFREAGIVSGMRVLDVGSGAGDVAFLAAELVGQTGEVVGVERAAAAVAAARQRAEARSLRNVCFQEGDPAEMAFEQPFDAVVGRFVLVFQKDPGQMLRKLARHVRSGGLIVFHEADLDGCRSFPPSPMYDRCCRWLIDALRLNGTETRMGIKLYSAFIAAGLPAPSMRLEALVGGGPDSADPIHSVADPVGALLPEMERLGVATAAEVGIETLADRMLNEAIASGSVIVSYNNLGAWSRL